MVWGVGFRVLRFRVSGFRVLGPRILVFQGFAERLLGRPGGY